jgi:hypothetical protein
MKRSVRLLVLVAASVSMTIACATPSAATDAVAMPTAATVSADVALEPYGPLLTATVMVAGKPRRFLVDTGGGMTVFSPELAAEAGCVFGPPLTGFRMSGERIDAPRCEGAQVSIGQWSSQEHTALVLDLNQMLPPEWPRLDGLLSLATFNHAVVTYDLQTRRLVVGAHVPARSAQLRVRFERQVTGLALGAFVATRRGDADYWLEIDTGNTGPVILNQPVAAIFALNNSSETTTIELNLTGTPLTTVAGAAPLRFDGNIGLPTMANWVLTFDLEHEQVWLATPAAP